MYTKILRKIIELGPRIRICEQKPSIMSQLINFLFKYWGKPRDKFEAKSLGQVQSRRSRVIQKWCGVCEECAGWKHSPDWLTDWLIGDDATLHLTRLLTCCLPFVVLGIWEFRNFFYLTVYGLLTLGSYNSVQLVYTRQHDDSSSPRARWSS